MPFKCFSLNSLFIYMHYFVTINVAGNREAVDEIVKSIGTEQYTGEQIRSKIFTFYSRGLSNL